MPLTAIQRAAAFGQPGKVPKDAVMTPWDIPTLVHPLVKERFTAACKEAAKLDWNPLRIDSYNPRPIRGTTNQWSMHAYCLAWDFFATGPTVYPPGGVWTPDNGVPVAFAACFERQGFRWGGRWTTRRDVPHIEWADAPPRGAPAPPIQPVQEDDMPQPAFDLFRDTRTDAPLWRVARDGQSKVWIRDADAKNIEKLRHMQQGGDGQEIPADTPAEHDWLDSIPTVS